jgi:Ca2+-transporting ATPase
MQSGAVLAALGTTARGLSSEQARERLLVHGPNVLAEHGRPTLPRLVLAQFADVMILVLLAAAALAGLIGDGLDAAAILAIVLVNAAVGVTQEYRAERALEALRALAAPNAVAVRAGASAPVPAAELVPGDVVRLEAGGLVPADLRLLEAQRLRVDESALTGESMPVDKATAASPAEAPIAERADMAYRGTLVTFGRGLGAVVATGARTELGRIATLLREAEPVPTPMQRRLAQLGRRLAGAALVVCAAVFALGVLRGQPPLLMLLTAVSLAVAAVPEALPAVVTVALALAARKMVERHALVRRLAAVETLGSVTYICADKTGTLTENRMRVEAVWRTHGPAEDGLFLRAMALCSDATLTAAGDVHGDPTEAALMSWALAQGLDASETQRDHPRLAEVPFDSTRKRMTTVHRDTGGGFLSLTKGAVESVLPLCAPAGGPRAEEVRRNADRMAADGLRVLAFTARRWRQPPPSEADDLETGLRFLGLAGLADPPRPEAAEAVRTCQAAGMVPVMITGDHPLTACAIARRLGILPEGGEVLTGAELARLDRRELVERAGRVRVYARVDPEQKLAIVEALQARGEVVAMTGDGVNDAPALKRADIGVAMGVAGTDVAKASSALILLDDDFATIVKAVREGRRVYDNVRRFVQYAISTNSAEVLTLFLAPLAGMPVPLLPLQILWINLVTDSLPGLALAAEPAEADVMTRPPRPPRESLLARGLAVNVLWVGLLMAVVTLAAQSWYLARAHPAWQTMVFTVLCFSQLGSALAVRSERRSVFAQGLLANRPLTAALLLIVLLHLAVIYVPWLQAVFRTQPLGAGDLAVAVGLSSVVFMAMELAKWVRGRVARGHSASDARGHERGASVAPEATVSQHLPGLPSRHIGCTSLQAGGTHGQRTQP